MKFYIFFSTFSSISFICYLFFFLAPNPVVLRFIFYRVREHVLLLCCCVFVVVKGQLYIYTITYQLYQMINLEMGLLWNYCISCPIAVALAEPDQMVSRVLYGPLAGFFPPR